MGAVRAEWGRVGPSRAEWGRLGLSGWGGVGHALGFNQITLRLGLATRIGQVGPREAGPSGAEFKSPRKLGAEWGRVGPSRAGGGVGHALKFNEITLRLGPGYKDRPSRAAWGRFSPSGAE